jgi:TPR repeat protein
MTSGSASKVGPEASSLLPTLGNHQQQIFSGQASAPDNKDAAQSFTTSPAPSEAPAVVGKDDVSQSDRASASKSADTSVVPATVSVSAPNSPAATALAPPISGLSKAELTELLHHGDALLRTGDISSARLFYERAADAGDGRAALRLGATFDPEFLGRLGLGKLQTDPAAARLWYSRARDLGEVDAKPRLNSLETRQGE